MQVEKGQDLARGSRCNPRLQLLEFFAHHAERGGQSADLVQDIAPLDRVLTNVEFGGRQQMRATDCDPARNAAAGQ